MTSHPSTIPKVAIRQNAGDSLCRTAANPRRGSASPPHHSLPFYPRNKDELTNMQHPGPSIHLGTHPIPNHSSENRGELKLTNICHPAPSTPWRAHSPAQPGSSGFRRPRGLPWAFHVQSLPGRTEPHLMLPQQLCPTLNCFSLKQMEEGCWERGTVTTGKEVWKGIWRDQRGTRDLAWGRHEWSSELRHCGTSREHGVKEEPQRKPKQGMMGQRIQAQGVVYGQHDNCEGKAQCQNSSMAPWGQR